MQRDSTDCVILILTYKGLHHLEHLLPTVELAIQNTPQFKIDVLIVDNGSSEVCREWVNANFPTFNYKFSPVNDYLFSLNPFVASLKSEFVFILNDDMKLDREIFNQSLPLIASDEDMFALGCKILDWDGEEETNGIRLMEYQNGWLNSHYVAFENNLTRYTLYGGGGAAVFRTAYFNELGGFNSLFRPAYGEDLDLGHRAWHRGWSSVINPKAILFHREGGTIHEQFASAELEQKVRRNNILWMLRNADRRGFLSAFFVLFPIRLIRWRMKHKNLYRAMLMSLSSWTLALKQRFAESSHKMNDEEIMEMLNKTYEIKR